MSLKIDIRDKRLRGGRLTLDAKTEKKVERRRREAIVRALLDAGEYELIEALRARAVDIRDVQRAHELTDSTARDAQLRLLRTRGSGSDERGPILGPAIERTMAKVEANRRPRTHRFYVSVSNAMLEHFTPDRRLLEILTSDAEHYLSMPQKTNGGKRWGASRQNMAAAFGSKVWQDAIKDDAERAEREGRDPLPLRNVWRLADKPAYHSPRVEYLRPEEWVTLREKTRGRAVCALLALGCRAGLRAEEATHLRVGLDVDLERRVIHVRARSGKHPWKPKNRRGERDVPMPDDLVEILREHIESGFAGDVYLIRAPGYDRPLSHSVLIKWTRAAFAAAGIQYGRKKDALTFHSLRHTFASWLTQKGMHPKKVARLIGDTPEMVLKVYGHLAEDDHGEAVQLLNEMLRAA